MKKIYLSIILVSQFLFSGCAGKEVVPCEPITITKKCETKRPIKPQMSDYRGDNVTWLKANIENDGKKDSYIFDLEAALEKCL